MEEEQNRWCWYQWLQPLVLLVVRKKNRGRGVSGCSINVARASSTNPLALWPPNSKLSWYQTSPLCTIVHTIKRRDQRFGIVPRDHRVVPFESIFITEEPPAKLICFHDFEKKKKERKKKRISRKIVLLLLPSYVTQRFNYFFNLRYLPFFVDMATVSVLRGNFFN